MSKVRAVLLLRTASEMSCNPDQREHTLVMVLSIAVRTQVAIGQLSFTGDDTNHVNQIRVRRFVA